MGFFSNLFGGKEKKSNIDVYSAYAKKILAAANLPANDANLLKGTVYLCFAQIACLDAVSQGKSRPFIDDMVEDAKNSILGLKMKVKDLATSNEELEKILEDFPTEADVDGNTTINGLAGWNALYFSYVQDIVVEISKRGNGPMGPHGYAAIKFLEALRGKGQSENDFMEVTMLLTEMTGEVIQAFR